MVDNKLPSSLKKYILSVVIGTSLEWYDFAIFGYFAPIYAMQFFPADNVFASLLSTFAVFAVGFLSRPLGAYIFGKIGDQYGRKQALLFSMILIGISTALMGLLPTYSQIGVLAPALLTLLRIFQGISMGGEFTSSLSFIIEHSPESRKGFVGAWIYSGGFLGSLLGMFIGTIMTFLTTAEQLYEWGWRIPFLLGLLITVFGYYFRYNISETPAFLQLKQNNLIEPHPFTTVVKKNFRQIFQVVGILLPNTVWVYLFVFIPAYLTDVQKWEFSKSLIVNLIPTVLLIFLIPFAGLLSDSWGRKKIMMIGQVALMILAPIFFQIFSEGNLYMIILMQIIVAIFFSLSYGPSAALLSEMFPTNRRNTGVAISYHIATGVFGGMTPLILTFLTSYLGINLGPTLWVISSGIIGMVTLANIKESSSEESVFA
jgi:MHS family proline/betaine transporter-like MFS transporter